jgi:hypothetical protein
VPDPHATLRRLKTRFDSWQGHGLIVSLRVCRAHGGLLNRKAGFDSRVGDRQIIKSSGCAGFAHDPAKVEDQVQFLAGTSLLLDAGARRHGDRLQPGSSGFDSHRRLFQPSCNPRAR